MTIPQLKNFLIIAETLNFRKSAEKIFIAQPALSRQVQQLEEEIGAQLFDRSKKNIQLTPAGTFFKKEAERLLQQLDQSMQRTAQIHMGEVGEWHIGHASSAMQSVLPTVLRQMHEKFPLLKTMLLEGTNRLIFEKLYNHELDVGFVPNAVAPSRMASRVIYRENFVLIFSKRHPYLPGKFTSLRDCAEEEWIFPPVREGYGYVEIVQRIFQKHGFLPKIAHESANASSVLRLTEAGLGITMMGKSTLNGIQLDIDHIELVDLTEKVEMRLVWLQEREKELYPLLSLLNELLPQQY